MKKSDYELLMTDTEFKAKPYLEQEDILNKLEERISELSDQEYENPTEKGGKLLNLMMTEYDDFWDILNDLSLGEDEEDTFTEADYE